VRPALSGCLYDKERLFLHDRLARTRQITLPKAPHPGKGKQGPESLACGKFADRLMVDTWSG
jgi:hypothetical protein